jgi:hypothetical protein
MMVEWPVRHPQCPQLDADADERGGPGPGGANPCRPAQGISHLRGAGADGGSRGAHEGIQGVSVPLGDIDRYWRRWRRARRTLRLADPLAADFGTGGLARHAPDVQVRFRVLPSDPGAAAVDFDDPFWEWWMQDRPNPFEGAAATHWGREALPEATAAINQARRPTSPSRAGRPPPPQTDRHAHSRSAESAPYAYTKDGIAVLSHAGARAARGRAIARQSACTIFGMGARLAGERVHPSNAEWRPES